MVVAVLYVPALKQLHLVAATPSGQFFLSSVYPLRTVVNIIVFYSLSQRRACLARKPHSCFSSSTAVDTSSNAGRTTSYASFDCAHNSFSLADTDSYTSPQFTAPPTDLVVANGETATLQCGVAGQPPPSVTWFREGGGEVTSGGRFTVGSTTGELTISSVELSDEGEYYCVASNAVGSVRSLSASLQLAGNNPPPTMFTYKILCLFSGIATRRKQV